MLNNKNPVLIQGNDFNCNEDAIPLVLIHDGGGTLFSYYCLGQLGRKVYGISNPRFFSGRPWTGGMAQMCKLYVKLIQTVIPCGKILLGGWSFGGIISLELTKQLAETNIIVAGIVMIDSICPLAFKDKPKLECRPIIPHTASSTAHTRPEMKLMIARSMKQAGDLLYSWDIPEFAPRRNTKNQTSHTKQTKPPTITITEIEVEVDSDDSANSGHSSPYSDDSVPSSRRSSNTSYSSEQDHESDIIITTDTPSKFSSTTLDLDMLNHSLLPSLPPIALLRCTDYVPTSISSPSTSPSSTSQLNSQAQSLLNGICKVDLTRDMPQLGWEDHDAGMVSYTRDIPGHHFDIFDSAHISRTTGEVREACLWLEREDKGGHW